MEEIDIVIVGAGAVGLAVAAELSKEFEDQTIIVMEKHSKFGQETSSRNSEVIHAGMYYPSGSLKAKLCVEGNPMLYQFCDQYHVPYQRLGKLIIARNEQEIPAIETVFTQGMANGVTDLKIIEQDQVLSMEPHIKAVAAIYSSSTGIIDSHKLMAQLERLAAERNVMIAYKHEVTNVEVSADGYKLTYTGPDGENDMIKCRWLINCAGLYADQIAAHLGIDIEATGYKIYPVKGEYFSVSNAKSKMVSHLVYPPPLKSLKGLGTHVTKSLDGRARLGPNAFYVDSRYEYDVDPNHLEEFYQSAITYLPFLERADLQSDMAGIRPKIQAPDAPVADFIIRHESDRGLPGVINLVGIESPGLTCSLSIAKMVAGLLKENFS